MADMFDKEELSIVSGLFPNTLAVANAEKQQQQNLAYERFSNAAGSRNPFGGLAGLQGMFGTAAGQDIQGVMGVQSPTTKLAALREQAAQKFDSNSPNGLVQMAQFLNQNGDSAGARQAVMLAQGQAQKSATLGKSMEETRILGRKEIEIGVDPKNPEMVQKALVDKDGNVLKMLGTPYSKFNQKTTIDARTIGPKNVLEIDKEDAANLVKVRNTAENIIPRLQEQAAALQKGIAAGTFSDARVVFATALSSLGVKDKATLDMLKNTKTFNSNRIELAASVAKQLGVNPTDRDFKASLDRFAAASDAPEASAAFIDDLLTIQQTRLKQANEGLSYYRENQGSFTGYNRPLPVSPVVSQDPFAGMTLDQLKKMRDDLQKNK
jgi:hypothetical protein